MHGKDTCMACRTDNKSCSVVAGAQTTTVSGWLMPGHEKKMLRVLYYVVLFVRYYCSLPMSFSVEKELIVLTFFLLAAKTLLGQLFHLFVVTILSFGGNTNVFSTSMA